MKKYNYYKFTYRGYKVIGQYMGREKHFACMVCDKGDNAYCFNVFDTLEKYKQNIYETYSFGREHLPELIEVKEEDLK